MIFFFVQLRLKARLFGSVSLLQRDRRTTDGEGQPLVRASERKADFTDEGSHNGIPSRWLGRVALGTIGINALLLWSMLKDKHNCC